MKKLFALLLVVLATTACQERPQRLESSVEPGYRTDNWDHQSRARGLRQSESTRIYQ